MALLALLLTGACARSGGAVQAPADEEAGLPFELSEEAPLGRHPGAGLCFPTGAPDGWRFTRTHLYDNDLGLDASWRYDHDDGTWASVFGYPKHREAPEGLTLAEAEARSAAGYVAGAEWTDAGSITLAWFDGAGAYVAGTEQRAVTELVPEELHAEVAAKLGLESLEGMERTMGALVAAWHLGDWMLKMRVTWYDVERSPEDVLRSLIGWSFFPCDALAGLDVPVEDLSEAGLSVERRDPAP